jgi:acyl carrier protein
VNKEQFLKNVQEVLESDETLTETTVLEDLDVWDSMAFIALLSFFDEHFDITVSSDALESCKTVGDLLNLVENLLQE